VFFPPPHTRLVNGDLGQPGAEPRLRTELPDVLKGFQHRLLGHVFGIGLIAQYGKGRSVHAPFVRPDQLIEEIVLAVPDTLDQHLFVEWFRWRFQRSHFFRHRSSP
jgi:hypothetical protein